MFPGFRHSLQADFREMCIRDSLIDRLVIPADKIAVKIRIDIIHFLNIRQRFKYKNVIHIKCMFWQLQSTFFQQFRLINNRMH